MTRKKVSVQGLSQDSLEALRKDHEKLRRAVENRQADWSDTGGVLEPEHYIAIPPKDKHLPAFDEATLTPGMVECCLYKATPDDPSDPAGSEYTLEPILKPDNKIVRVLVLNIHSQEIPYQWLPVSKVSHGMFLAHFPAVTTTTATTSTTGVVPECEGDCWWEWHSVGAGPFFLEWELIEEDTNCVAITSTTTSTTTTCWCPDEGHTAAWSAQGFASPSVQAIVLDDGRAMLLDSFHAVGGEAESGPIAPGCQCAYPTFCGIEDGDRTRTQCVPYQTSPPNCGPTTTTTCECDTTTTFEDTCTTEQCTWDCLPPPPDPSGSCFSTWQWKLRAGTECPQTLPPTHYCDCPIPTEPCSSSASACDSETTSCSITSPPTPQPDPCDDGFSCSGICWFWWIPSLSAWVLYCLQCSGKGPPSAPCTCFPPDEPGDFCSPTLVDCGMAYTTTTGEDCGCPRSCYTSSTTSTTTTPGDPCIDGFCRWRANASLQWVLEYSGCPTRCPCLRPPWDPQEEDEVDTTPCAGSTTTTAFPTTTTTATTTTTSVIFCPDNCGWTCWDNVWYPYPADACGDSCNCPGPPGTPCTNGQSSFAECQPGPGP